MKKLPVYQIKKFHCDSKENELYVNDFKSHLKDHDFIEKPHSHNFYLLVLFTKGNGTHTVDFDTFLIKRGHLYFLKPGQVHSWQLSQDIDGYIAFYSQQAYDVYFGQKKIDTYSFYRSLKNAPELVLNEAELASIKQYFDLLIQENNSNQPKKRDKLLNLIDTIHIELERIYDAESGHNIHPYNLKISALETWLDQYFKLQKSPSFYAEKMNMSLKHLNRICKTVLNMTLTECIYSKVILESKRLLSAGNLNIAQVADAMGFEDYPYFTKVFKRYAGMTPQQFKKQLM